MLRFILYLGVLIAALFTGAANAQERVALLIGNQDYKPGVGRLSNPINDVKIVGNALRKVGFTILEPVVNATRAEILDAIDRYAATLRDAGPDAIGFIYYSGHGIAARGRNYLIPVDVTRPTTKLLRAFGIQQSEILEILRSDAPNAAHYLIVDACRNELRGARGGKGFVAVNQQSGTLIAFATAPGATASDQGKGGGPYAKALASEIVKPGVADLLMFHRVRVAVTEATGGDQVPWTLDGIQRSERVKFGGEKPRTPVRPTFSQQAELAFWNSVKDGNDSSLLQAYLKTYPNGTFALVARALSEKLKKSAEQKALTLIKQEELRAAKEKERLAKLARDRAETEERRRRQSAELKKAREEATRARQALRLVEQQRKEALLAAKEAQQRIAEQAARVKTAALSDPPESAQSKKGQTQAGEEEGNPLDLARRIQTELKRLGCLSGAVDGIWGRGSRQALASFNRYAKLKLPTATASPAIFSALQLRKSRVCPNKPVAKPTSKSKQTKSSSRTQTGSANNTKTAKARKKAAARACADWRGCAARYSIPVQQCGLPPRGC